MSLWDDKVKQLKNAVDALAKTPRQSLCIHGDENCVRCATEFIDDDTQFWEPLVQDDLRRIVFALPEEIQTMMRKHPTQVTVAGGFIRALVANEEVHDIDVFVDTESQAKKWADDEDLEYEEKDKHLHLEGEEGEPEIQIIWRYNYKQPVEVPAGFDYTVCKAAIWFDNGDKNKKPGFTGTCHKNFYRDIARKMLVYDCDRDVERIESFPRLLKYITYGYSIEPHSLAELVAKTCISLNLSNGLDGLINQLEGCYKPSGIGDEWNNINKVYIKPKPRKRKKPKPVARTHDYSYGS